jgi:hypothetical protein
MALFFTGCRANLGLQGKIALIYLSTQPHKPAFDKITNYNHKCGVLPAQAYPIPISRTHCILVICGIFTR